MSAVSTIIEAVGHLGQVVTIIEEVNTAEAAGQGHVDVPDIHFSVKHDGWTIHVSADKDPKPAPHPPLPSPPA